MRAYPPSGETLYYAVWPGTGKADSHGIPPDFYPPHMNVGLWVLPPLLLALCPGSATPPLPPIWVSVVSLNPWMSDLHTGQLLRVLGVIGFWDLALIISMALQGGKVCLPMLPSWPEAQETLLFKEKLTGRQAWGGIYRFLTMISQLWLHTWMTSK